MPNETRPEEEGAGEQQEVGAANAHAGVEIFVNDGDEEEQQVRDEEDQSVSAPTRRAQQGQPMPTEPVHSMDDPARMVLTDQEREWALDIKDAIESLPDVDNLSDFMYAQFAIIEKANIEGAVERAYNLQAFREEYQVKDTIHDGARCVHSIVRLFPRYLLSFGFSVQDGYYFFVSNLAGFSLKEMDTQEKFSNLFRGGYYILSCLCPDFESIRQGTVLIAECQGYDWTKNVSARAYKLFWSDLARAYPIQYQKIKYFHSGLFVNLLLSMAKPFMPMDARETIEVGCQFDGSLDDIYLTPTVEMANQRLLERMEESLRRRYLHEKNFSL